MEELLKKGGEYVWFPHNQLSELMTPGSLCLAVRGEGSYIYD